MNIINIIKSYLPDGFQVFANMETNEFGEADGVIIFPDGKLAIGFEYKPKVLDEGKLRVACQTLKEYIKCIK